MKLVYEIELDKEDFERCFVPTPEAADVNGSPPTVRLVFSPAQLDQLRRRLNAVAGSNLADLFKPPER